MTISSFIFAVLRVQSPCRAAPRARRVCCPRQCSLHSWRQNAAGLILLILAQCTCVGHNIVCPLKDDCDGCVFINCNINNTAQYIWCFLATIPRSANTWLVQPQIQAPCKPDTLLNASTSLLWFVMLQIEHKTVDGHRFSVRFKWILKVFSPHCALFYTVDFLAYLQIKGQEEIPRLSSTSGKPSTRVQLCPLGLSSEKNRHLQNSTQFSFWYPQRAACLTLFCWVRWMPSKLHMAEQDSFELVHIKFGSKVEVWSPEQHHLQCHWKKVALVDMLCAEEKLLQRSKTTSHCPDWSAW